jgi:chromosome segregation ATPase
MEISQLARMIEWLDEERRRDKQTIATLEERLTQQQDTISTLQRRLGAIESDQSVIHATSTSATHLDTDLLEQLRKEMRQLLEASEAKRLTAERELERRAGLERQTLSRPVQELTEKITKLERTTTEVPALQMERDRLATMVTNLQQRFEDLLKRLEEPDRRLTFIEEQRRNDVRRIAELESETPELKKQFEGIRPKLTLLEDLTLRNERRIQELQNTERDRREQIQQFIDQQTLMLQQRDQQVADLLKKMADQDSMMKQNFERFETWSDAYRSMKTIIDDFNRIGERLERRISEVAETQRLSEERFRQEWNDWRSDDSKRWKQFTLSTDESWRLHDKEFERFVERFETLLGIVQPLNDGLERLWKLERERALMYREYYQNMLAQYDTNKTNYLPSNGNGTSTP